MALSAADVNQARVEILGRSVDQPGAGWTSAPPAAANTLNTTERMPTRLLNLLDQRLGGAIDGTNGFSSKFTSVVGDEATTDQAAFDSIGMNLIQAVAALVAGGGISPAVSFEFVFPDPLQTNDFVEVQVPSDITIPAQLAGSEYLGMPEPDNMYFELTEEPAGTVIGQVDVVAGNVVTMHGGASVSSGMTLRMTAVDIVAGSVSPGAVIKIVAERKAAPTTAGRYVHEQTTAANSWTITHDLGFAQVQPYVVRDTGAIMWPNITYLSNDQCRLDFAQAVSGTAILRR